MSSVAVEKHHFTSFPAINWLISFMNDCYKLLNRCTKPDRREYFKIATAVLIGFLIMGFIGFFVKLVHIPINNIIVGGRA